MKNRIEGLKKCEIRTGKEKDDRGRMKTRKDEIGRKEDDKGKNSSCLVLLNHNILLHYLFLGLN